MIAVRGVELPHLHAFTRGLDIDKNAVRAALTLPFHNGWTEGVNTKTKRITRQMATSNSSRTASSSWSRCCQAVRSSSRQVSSWAAWVVSFVMAASVVDTSSRSPRYWLASMPSSSRERWKLNRPGSRQSLAQSRCASWARARGTAASRPQDERRHRPAGAVSGRPRSRSAQRAGRSRVERVP